MKYKVGDRVKIQSLERYNKHKNRYGDINYGCETEILFTSEMSSFCGQVVTITRVRYIGCVRFYHLAEDKGVHLWVDGMFEGLVEEETKPLTYEETVEIIEAMQGIGDSWECPQGYQFVDENGNVINAKKIVLEKKKKEYPKTYAECCRVLGVNTDCGVKGYKIGLLSEFQMLLICRDAYWKIAGEEMGLGKPWEPDWGNEDETKWVIFNLQNKIKLATRDVVNAIFAFPTEEMRDSFYENFKELINEVKELL